MRWSRSAHAALLFSTVLSVPAGAATCPENTVDSGSTPFIELVTATVEGLFLDTPLESPSAEKLTAASRTDASTDLVDGPVLPSLLGLALNSGVVATDDGAATLSLNLFAFKAMVDPEVVDVQSKYEKYDRLRRFGGTISVGGRGASFDRDGDGLADPPLEAEELGDIVTWDIQYRFAGSRDRRDEENYKELHGAVEQSFTAAADAWSRVYYRAHQVFGDEECIPKTEVVERLSKELGTELRAAGRAQAILQGEVSAQLQRIDGHMVWTGFFGGTSRREEFGQDEIALGLRGAWGIGQTNSAGGVVNAEWRRTDGVAGADDQTTLKIGAEYSTFLLKGRLGLPDDITFAAGAAFEMFDNVPDAAHESIARVNAKLEIPLREGISIPLSVSWANHADLLEDESEVRGHVGFTFDLSPGELLKAPR